MMAETMRVVGVIAQIIEATNGGPGSVRITRDEDGKSTVVKAWPDAIEGKKVGDKGEFELFNKPYNGKPQYYLSGPKKSGGRGGGQAKSDPVKNEIIKNANENNNATIQYGSNLKAATSCMEMSVATLGPDQDVNAYRERAFDLYQIIQEIAAIGSAHKK